ncbi:MAG TPA: S1 RNA-binding domain-containing protein, partial [Chitinophagales bacterium]|nr:S1 RNA-binding domain-containing protein [Chitinophagales bacterium]
MANTEQEKPTAEITEAESAPAATPAQPPRHDDFDWELGKRSVAVYSEEEKQNLEKLYEKTLTTVNENEIIKGTVVGITKTDVVLNVGFKSDGLVPISEFRDLEELKLGDEVEVYVVDKEDSKGHLVLSRKNAKLMRGWEKIVNAYNTGEVVTGHIISKTKGGLIVNVFGLETFLPGSQIDVKPITDYDSYVGKKMEFKVVKINEAIKNAVVSHKALIESDLESQRMDIISKLDIGQVLEGTVKNITDFGAFIDLGG